MTALSKRGGAMVSASQIGEVIRTCRVQRGLSQEVLSGLAGLDRTHYSKIERGLRSPTIDTFYKIAQALDIPLHQLMEELERYVAAPKIVDESKVKYPRPEAQCH